MDRLARAPGGVIASLRGLGSFLVIVGILFLLLRVVHLGVPVFYPEVLAGPFSLSELEEAAAYTGFAPLTPSYHPRELGGRPVHVTARRRPAELVVFWQGERFLRLEQQREGVRVLAGALPPTAPTVIGWRAVGSVQHVEALHDGIHIGLTSDLPRREVERILATLHPVRGPQRQR